MSERCPLAGGNHRCCAQCVATCEFADPNACILYLRHRAEIAEAKVAQLTAQVNRVEALAEKWRAERKADYGFIFEACAERIDTALAGKD